MCEEAFRLNTQNIKMTISQKVRYDFFLFSPYHKKSTHCTLKADKSFKSHAIILSKISQILSNFKKKKTIIKTNHMIFFQIFTKYFIYHPLSPDKVSIS